MCVREIIIYTLEILSWLPVSEQLTLSFLGGIKKKYGFRYILYFNVESNCCQESSELWFSSIRLTSITSQASMVGDSYPGMFWQDSTWFA